MEFLRYRLYNVCRTFKERLILLKTTTRTPKHNYCFIHACFIICFTVSVNPVQEPPILEKKKTTVLQDRPTQLYPIQVRSIESNILRLIQFNVRNIRRKFNLISTAYIT